MNKVYLLLGSNLENRGLMLDRARQLIRTRIGPIIAVSSIYESTPWGFSDNHLFLNQVLEVETSLSSGLLLDVILGIEQELGRVREGKGYNSRLIDIDILFYNDDIIDNHRLTVPHPRIPERRFALLPLHEVNATLVHPVLNKSIRVLLEECSDQLEVIPYDLN
jgi:2-amino-4-hydroxy-6-hydroxymethyldihydropteridine diphosphokinase